MVGWCGRGYEKAGCERMEKSSPGLIRMEKNCGGSQNTLALVRVLSK